LLIRKIDGGSSPKFCSVIETERFWNYYQSTGWKDGKGRAIKDKMSAARLWKTGEAATFSKETYPFISILRAIFHKKEGAISILNLIQDIKKIEIKEDKIFLRTTRQIVELIESNVDILRLEFNIFYKNKKLEYIINE